MVHWSDLPAELRLQILRYVFTNSIVSHQPPKLWWRRRSHTQVLSLLLVSKSFAQYDDIVRALLSEAALSVRSDYDALAITANLKYGPKPLNHLRVLELADDFRVEARMRLREFKFMLPSLARIHVPILDTSFPSLSDPPAISVSAGFMLDPLLLAARSATTHLVFTDPDDPDRFDLLHPFATTRMLLDDLFTTLHNINMDIEYKDDPFYQSSRFALVGALTQPHHRDNHEILPARWLSMLLTDALHKDNQVEVTLSWALDIIIRPLPGSTDCLMYALDPAYFSTKDMCLRFHVNNHQGLVPQVFSDYLRHFAEART